MVVVLFVYPTTIISISWALGVNDVFSFSCVGAGVNEYIPPPLLSNALDKWAVFALPPNFIKSGSHCNGNGGGSNFASLKNCA